VVRQLERARIQAEALHGDKSQNRRTRALDNFRRGITRVLVATDIAARGIDISEISHVINFDMPDTVDAYTHRIGRTGRAENTGEAFTFTIQADEPIVRQIERTLGRSIQRRCLPGFAPASEDGSETYHPSNSLRASRRRNFRISTGPFRRRLRVRH